MRQQALRRRCPLPQIFRYAAWQPNGSQVLALSLLAAVVMRKGATDPLADGRRRLG